MGRNRVDKTAPINDDRKEKEADNNEMRGELKSSALDESASTSNDANDHASSISLPEQSSSGAMGSLEQKENDDQTRAIAEDALITEAFEVASSQDRATDSGAAVAQEEVESVPRSKMMSSPSQSTVILTTTQPEELEAELRSQVSSLNTKLVAAINRMSDLEDELTVSQNSLRANKAMVEELSKERDQYVSALSTGLLVEKSHVSSEMQRMMERVVDATAQRGKAENDRTRIEAELEELSASLFNEANKMVAVERLNRSRSETRSKELEASLQDAERIMADHQEMLKSLQSEVDALRKQPAQQGSSLTSPMRAPQIHINIPPYQEFLAFLSHIRGLRQQLDPFFAMQKRGEDWTKDPSINTTMSANGNLTATSAASYTRHNDYPHLPVFSEQLVRLSSQTSLPFIRRVMEEDTDPCLRLSQAPGLTWLARRQASASVLDGEVVIEPLFVGGIVPDERALRTDYGALPAASCTLCSAPLLNVTSIMEGTPHVSSADAGTHRPHSAARANPTTRRSFPSLFQTLRRGHADRSRTLPSDDPKEKASMAESTSSPGLNESLPIPTHYFRLSEQASNRYLLCSQHCLYRLRAICAIWAFIRALERAVVLEGKDESDMLRLSSILPLTNLSDKPRVPDADASNSDASEPANEAENDKDPIPHSDTSKPGDVQELEGSEAPSDPSLTGENPSSPETPSPAIPTAPTAARTSFTGRNDRQGLKWEESLWMEVLRYKEVIWKARVGMDLENLHIV